jgi:hypothetical protein
MGRLWAARRSSQTSLIRSSTSSRLALRNDDYCQLCDNMCAAFTGRGKGAERECCMHIYISSNECVSCWSMKCVICLSIVPFAFICLSIVPFAAVWPSCNTSKMGRVELCKLLTLSCTLRLASPRLASPRLSSPLLSSPLTQGRVRD